MTSSLLKSVGANATTAIRHVSITVRVRGMARLRARMWLGVRLIRLAAWVMGVPVAVEVNADARR